MHSVHNRSHETQFARFFHSVIGKCKTLFGFSIAFRSVNDSVSAQSCFSFRN
jgi:hypothetical protein